jgi:selenocysteine lyase/cysteine desulfurase
MKDISCTFKLKDGRYLKYKRVSNYHTHVKSLIRYVSEKFGKIEYINIYSARDKEKNNGTFIKRFYSSSELPQRFNI